MTPLFNLLKSLLAAAMAEAIVRVVQRLGSDPEFRKNAGVVFEKTLTAVTKEDTDAASRALHDLLRK